MSERTGIEWTDSTWNPWYGCHKVSPGCKICYMFREQVRYGRDPNVVTKHACLRCSPEAKTVLQIH
jgi:protein gp37